MDPSLVSLNTHLSNTQSAPQAGDVYACLTRKDQAVALVRGQSGLFSFSHILIILLT